MPIASLSFVKKEGINISNERSILTPVISAGQTSTCRFAFPESTILQGCEIGIGTLRYQRYPIRNVAHSTVFGGCEI